MHEIIRFYTESTQHKSENTRLHATEVITRILTSFADDYGVQITNEVITGLTPVILQKWYNEAAKTRKVSTMNNYVCMLNPFLRWCFEMEFIDRDLSSKLGVHRLPDPETIPPEERPKDKYLSHGEAFALLHCTGRNYLRDRAIIALFLYSGLRVSELCSLNLGDVLGNAQGTIIVRRKGGHYKPVEVSPEFYPVLEEYLKTRTDLDDLTRPLFLTTHGERVNRKQIHKFLSHKQRKLGVATGPHALRHTFLSETEKIGGAAIARDLANQKSFSVTNRYVHTTVQQRRDTVRRLRWEVLDDEH